MAYNDGYYALGPQTAVSEDEDSNFNRALMRAADSHNILNNGESWYDGLLSTVENIPKAIGLSIASGANQIYNIAPTVGNWFGGTFEQNDLKATLQDYDDDLAKYYTEHQQAIDVVGFIASSLVPGTAGVKLLRGGQTLLEGGIASGILGENLAKSVGLLATAQPRNLKAAVDAIRTTGQTFSILEANTLRALGAGFGQAALEGAAFETAVAATLYNSPVLKDQDFGDIISNITSGALLFGGIGGVITGAKTLGALKKARVTAAAEEFPYTHITETTKGTTSAHRISLWLEDLRQMPAVPEGLDVSARRLSLAQKKTETIHGAIRKEFLNLSEQDAIVAEQAANSIRGLPADAAIANVWEMRSITRLSETSKLEAAAISANKKLKSLKYTEEELKLASNTSTKYLKITGDDAYIVTGEAPKVFKLADTLKAGEEIKISGSTVTAGGKTYKFNPKEDFDVTKVHHTEAEARMILAETSAPLSKGAVIFENDIAFLTKAYVERTADVAVKLADGSGTRKFLSQEELFDFIVGKKESLINKLFYTDLEKVSISTTSRKAASDAAIKAAKESGIEDKLAYLEGARAAKAIPKETARSQEEIAKLVDVKNSYISGKTVGEIEDNVFASRAHLKEHNAMLKSKGLPEVTNLHSTPSYLKITYDTTLAGSVKSGEVEAMVLIKQDQLVRQAAIDRVIADALPPEISSQLVDVSDKMMLSANPLGAGPKFFAFANGNYGTLASVMEYVGNVTTRAIKGAKEAAVERLNPSLMALRNNQAAAIELENIMAVTRGTGEKYVLNSAGDALVLRKIQRYEKAVAEARAAGKELPKAPEFTDPNLIKTIPIKHLEARDFIAAHIEVNGNRLSKISSVRAVQNGLRHEVDPLTFYPPARNPKDYPFFAFVVDDTVTGTGHSKMLYANTERELQAQINQVQSKLPQFKVLTKGEAETYYKNIGKFEYERTLSENYIDVAMARKGVSTPFLIRTDPAKITDDLLNWHTANEASTVRELISAKYDRQFHELRRLGEQYTNAATSKYGGKSLVKYAESTIQNPYVDYIKTALGINTAHEYPYWMPIQKMLDTRVSQLFSAVDEVRSGAKSVEDLSAINKMMQEAGYKGAYYDAALNTLANHTAPRAIVTDFVQKANSILATFTLRLDPLNSLNNVIGSNVLRSTELKAVIRAIEQGNADAVGQLAALTKIRIPGTDKSMLSAGKLLQKAVNNYHLDSTDPLKAFYREKGFITSITDQYKGTLDMLALRGNETPGMLSSKLKAAYELTEKGAKLTGNNLAEEFNRFVSADVMRQITDVAVAHNLMTQKEALSYINTFVNRVEGNYLAAQRPMMFQGPVGQAIGLFQTYQFNLIQQLLRHVGEGSAKDAAMLLGMQGTIYGLNGLPAFNAINTHVIGTASGNTNHTDAYEVAYGAAGREAGDWLMYGVASNMLLHPDLKMNLYTRGDINPRHVTVVPTNPADIPFVNASGKFFGNLFETVSKLGAGGDVVGTLLQGMEHNGISRPLAGLAQTLEGFNNPQGASFSTSKKGNVIASNDMVSLASLSRLAGAKPLDEAIVQDATFRLKAYAAKDADRTALLGEAIKTTVIAGKAPSQEQIDGFVESYVNAGGKAENFNKFFLKQYKSANTSQANAMKEALSTPGNQGLQKIMGGYELKDFNK